MNVTLFNKLVNENKDRRPWYFGLQGTWWWGMSKEGARNVLMEKEKKEKIAIASIVRNEESSGNLGRFLGCCLELEQYHNIVYIFVEGDSSDRTYQVLNDWVSTRDGVLEKRDRGNPHYSKIKDSARTTILGELRNILVELIFSKPNVAEVLMIDASYGWNGDLITTLRETDADIAAPLNFIHKDNNGLHIFYDIWAYRKNGACFGPFYPYCAGFDSNNPIDIDSCGGGYLVRRSVFEAGVRYNGQADCEHVSFCQDARFKGFSIKMNPRTYIRKGGYKE